MTGHCFSKIVKMSLMCGGLDDGCVGTAHSEGFTVFLRIYLHFCKHFGSINLGIEFAEKLDRYMRPAIRKGVPPLFVNLRSLYDNKEKVNCLE